MSTLLEIVQDAFSELTEQDIPASVVGNGDPNAIRALALANRAGKALNCDAPSGWEATRREYQFLTVADQEAYDAPADYDSMIPHTYWDKLNYWRVNGPATPAFYNYLRSAIVAVGVRRWLYFEDGKFHLHPVPADSDFPISIWYRSNAWCRSATGTLQTRWLADNDEPRLNADLMTMGLKWRLLQADGLPYMEAKQEYAREVDKVMARDGGMPVLNMAGNKILPWGMVNVQEGNYG